VRFIVGEVRRTRSGDEATHMLTVTVPMRLINNVLIDQTVVTDIINLLLSLLRVAGSSGTAEVEVSELELLE
jgi:hypothetical protein